MPQSAEALERKRARWKIWAAANKEKRKAYSVLRGYPTREEYLAYRRKYNAENRDRINENGRRYNAENPEKRRSVRLKSKYGLSAEQWDATFVEQGNVCKICKSSSPNYKGGWHTDHCHKTNQVRGILCHSCNIALGAVKDNLETLSEMIVYLIESNRSSVHRNIQTKKTIR